MNRLSSTLVGVGLESGPAGQVRLLTGHSQSILQELLEADRRSVRGGVPETTMISREELRMDRSNRTEFGSVSRIKILLQASRSRPRSRLHCHLGLGRRGHSAQSGLPGIRCQCSRGPRMSP